MKALQIVLWAFAALWGIQAVICLLAMSVASYPARQGRHFASALEGIVMGALATWGGAVVRRHRLTAMARPGG
jgi:hypothetical protein